MKLKKSAVLFDMDGTLVGLKPDGRLAILQHSLAHFGIGGVEQGQADRFWFSAERYTMLENWAIPAEAFWQVLDSERLLQIQLEQTICFNDVAVIRHLSRLNLQLGIVSNSAHISLRGKLKILGRHVKPGRFQQVTSCSDDAPRPKPCPSGILFSLEKMGVAPQDALLVGDSMDDVRAGYAAGVEVVVIDRGEPIQFDQTYPFRRITSLWKLKTMLAFSEAYHVSLEDKAA